MAVRVTVLIGFFALLYSALIFRLYVLQVNEGEKHQAKAFSTLEQSLKPVRGNIYFTDKAGNAIPAAINRDYPSIYTVPKDVKDEEREGVSELLAGVSGQALADIEAILDKKTDPYELIVKRATDEEVGKVESAGFKGAYIGYNSGRFYPLGTLAAQLLGFVSADDKVGAAYGVELYYQKELGGKAGSSSGDKIISDTEDGQDIHLTIDRKIQEESENILTGLMKQYKAESGTVIVEEPRTGKILAMASSPNFDPNNYSDSKVATFLNPAVQAVYEPGSIFKLVTMSSALDAHAVTPSTTYNDTGSLKLNGKIIKNWDLKAHGVTTMTGVIEQSLNTGAAFAERALGNDAFYAYVTKFGFKEKSGIDLPGEVVGSLRPLESDKRDINFATASFGQGISTTPITLLQAVASIANHGVMMKPYINAADAPRTLGRTISEEASRQTVQMMVSAVIANQVAHIDGYNVAGKTGTAQIPDFVHGGYSNQVVNTFIGFVPAYDPKFIILVKLDKPVGTQLAGQTVVPAFRNLAQFIINYYNIPPDNVSH
ncbi:MAG TPA: penicillin-binding protein 2 [Candidatus Paceibacterota bacterium]|nr:penicillin-binding protein 2 [Candidatus Paceibacterota bacterium]